VLGANRTPAIVCGHLVIVNVFIWSKAAMCKGLQLTLGGLGARKVGFYVLAESEVLVKTPSG
jgi:hypothetical protein